VSEGTKAVVKYTASYGSNYDDEDDTASEEYDKEDENTTP